MNSSIPITRPAASIIETNNKIGHIGSSNLNQSDQNNTSTKPSVQSNVAYSPNLANTPCPATSSVWTEMRDESKPFENDHIRNMVLAYLEFTGRHDVVRAVLEGEEQAGLLERKTNVSQSNISNSNIMKNNNNNNNNTTNSNDVLKRYTRILLESSPSTISSRHDADNTLEQKHSSIPMELLYEPSNPLLLQQKQQQLSESHFAQQVEEKLTKEVHGKLEFSKSSYKWLVQGLLRRNRLEKRLKERYQSMEDAIVEENAHKSNETTLSQSEESKELSTNPSHLSHSQSVSRRELAARASEAMRLEFACNSENYFSPLLPPDEITVEEKALPSLCSWDNALECDLRLLYANAKVQLIEQYMELSAPEPCNKLCDAVVEQQVNIPMWSSIDEHVVMFLPNPVDVQTNGVIHGTLNQLVEELTFVHITPATYMAHFASSSEDVFDCEVNNELLSSEKVTSSKISEITKAIEAVKEEVTAKSNAAYKFATAFLRQHRRITSSSVLLGKLMERFCVPFSIKLGFDQFMAHGITIHLPQIYPHNDNAIISNNNNNNNNIDNINNARSSRAAAQMCERAHSQTMISLPNKLNSNSHIERTETLSSFSSPVDHSLAHLHLEQRSVSASPFFASQSSHSLLASPNSPSFHSTNSSSLLPPATSLTEMSQLESPHAPLKLTIKHYSPSATL